MAGTWFAQHTDSGGGIVWDDYFLYGPDATWAPSPGHWSVRPLIDSSADLVVAFPRSPGFAMSTELRERRLPVVPKPLQLFSIMVHVVAVITAIRRT